MKAIETITTDEGKVLTVIVETMPNDDTKGYVSYFINGVQVQDWAKLKKQQQRLFNALADNLCEGLCLTKWSY
jgi:hypothetical protein